MENKQIPEPELTEREKLIILLIGANDNEPIPSVDHLAAELFLCERALGVDNGPIKTENLTLYPAGKKHVGDEEK